jgi:hypothetical protein
MSRPRFRLPQKYKDDTKSSSSPGNNPFSSVPRFSTRQIDTFTSPTFSPYQDLNLNHAESIQDISSTQDVSQSDLPRSDGQESDEEMLFNTFEDNQLHTDSPLSKRQKISDDSEPPDNFELPFSPKRPGFTVNHLMPTTTKSITVDEQAETPLRPMFIVPFQAAGSVEAALPAIFSPQRTTQRLLPSGLASSLRTEIMELTARKNGCNLGDIPSGTNIKVVKAHPMAGYTAIQGRVVDGITFDFLLLGNGQSVAAGSKLTLRGINWNVTVQSKTWIVVLDWRVDD